MAAGARRQHVPHAPIATFRTLSVSCGPITGVPAQSFLAAKLAVGFHTRTCVNGKGGMTELHGDDRRGALAQQLLERIVELEDENRALRGDLVTLRWSPCAARRSQ